MKRLTALLLSALMIMSVLPMMSFSGRFEDVSDGKWYSEGISFCAANGYMAGTSETVFDRGAELSRSMFVTVLAKIDGVDLTPFEGKSSFSDVKTDGWYTSAIEWAYQNELASGIGDGVFGYKNPVTREQMALFLYAYAEYVNANSYEITVPDVPIDGPIENHPADDPVLTEEEVTPEKPELPIDTTLRADLSVFKDADRVHSWAKDAMEWAVACELFSGIGEDLLDPRGNCTRAQAAVLIRAFVLGFLTDCEHEWVMPTCTEMSSCTKCELKNATELGHDAGDRNCTVETPCIRCGIAVPGVEHKPKGGNCTIAPVCTVCSASVGDPPGHDTSNGICKKCGAEVFATPHDKLLYYLITEGETTEDGYKCFYEVESVDDGGYIYEYGVFVKPGDSTVYMQYTFHNNYRSYQYSATAEIAIPSNETTKFDIWCMMYDAESVHWMATGNYVTGSVMFGSLESIEGPLKDEGNPRSDINNYTESAIYHGDKLIEKYANGLGMEDFGFDMSILW